MPKASRILVPITLALLLAGGFVGFLWWQVSASTSMLALNPFLTKEDRVETTVIELPSDPRDLSLLHLRQGDIYALRGEWRKAQIEYEKAVKADGGLPALRKLVRAELQRRDIRNARSTIKKMKQAGARPEDTLLIESIVELRLGELVKAKEILDAAAPSPQKHYGLALLAIIQGDHVTGQQELTEVINGWEPILRSNARTLQGAYDEFALFPEGSNLHLITLLSRALAQVQECELALPLLTQVTDINTTYRDAWIVQGYCELITERPEQALLSLEHAYNIDPQKPEIQYFLARTYRALGQNTNAITFLEYSLVNGFTPEDDARLLLAEVALEERNIDVALEQYEALSNKEEATIEIFEGYVQASIDAGMLDEAVQKAREATERFPHDARSFVLFSNAASAAGNTDEANEAYKKAKELNPTLDQGIRMLQ